MTSLKTGLIIAFSFFLMTGCNTLSGVAVQGPESPKERAKYHKSGPPPHAPAHGYRHKNQHGHEMEYNSDAGAYVVLNVPETFFADNLYIRIGADGSWQVSARLDSGWRVALASEIPSKLRAYKYKQKAKNNKGKKNKKHKNKDKDGD